MLIASVPELCILFYFHWNGNIGEIQVFLRRMPILSCTKLVSKTTFEKETIRN